MQTIVLEFAALNIAGFDLSTSIKAAGLWSEAVSWLWPVVAQSS
jgi:hypothetical protein